MKQLIAIVGPTGVGKSTLALKIAPLFQGEIVSCDSRQVYRLMNIGTAKPSPEEMAAVPQHLVDMIYPDEILTLARYQELSYRAIEEIQRRDKLPFLVGGTGQYFRAVVEDWEIPGVAPDMSLRHSLEAEVAGNGIEKLFDELKTADPAAAAKIDPRNARRVIRALEVIRSRGVPFSSLQKKGSVRDDTLIIGLTLDRQTLYDRVDARVNRMMTAGLVAEVRKLLDLGYDLSLPSMSSIGYRQIGEYLLGKIDLDTAVQQVKFETHRYIRQQYAWFRLKDERIHWFNIINNVENDIIGLINNFVNNHQIT